MLLLNQVKDRRKNLAISMDHAAQLAGIKGGRQKWHAIETGRNNNPSIRTMIGMAKALRCSVADLIDEPYPPGSRRQHRSQSKQEVSET